MKVNRRDVIKQFVVFSAGIALIPSCMQETSKAGTLLKNIKINGSDEQLLAELAETIIPKTDTPGARDISAHLFALKMVDDCFKKENQDKFVNGLAEFKKLVKSKFDKSFIDCAVPERTSLLTELESGKKEKNDLSFFYSTTKDLTIQAYTTSEFYLTKLVIYKLVPGRYYGCLPVAS